MSNTTRTKVAATIVIVDADKMTKRGRTQIARWLEKQALMLKEHGKEYSPRFRGRYLYADKAK